MKNERRANRIFYSVGAWALLIIFMMVEGVLHPGIVLVALGSAIYGMYLLSEQITKLERERNEQKPDDDPKS